MTYREFLENYYYSPGIGQIYIDNLIMFLNYLSEFPIRAVTMTPEGRLRKLSIPEHLKGSIKPK